jgi:hypothetical protein
MKHSRFKYFSKCEYAETFLDEKLFCQTAAFFRDYEDARAQQIIGDEYEGTRLYRPANGLQISNLPRIRRWCQRFPTMPGCCESCIGKEARRIEAQVRELLARPDRENPRRFEVDWRDLQTRAN